MSEDEHALCILHPWWLPGSGTQRHMRHVRASLVLPVRQAVAGSGRQQPQQPKDRQHHRQVARRRYMAVAAAGC